VATLLARALHKLRKVGRGEAAATVAEKHVR
jgi:hypothetical protein